MKVLLIHPGLGPGNVKIFPPLGAMGIACFLQKHSVATHVVDLTGVPIENALPPILHRKAPDVVGITVLIGDVARRAIEASELTKREFPEVRVVWGGPLAATDPDWIRSRASVDATFAGDGERQLLAWIRTGMRSLRGAPFAVEEAQWADVFGGAHALQRDYVLPANRAPELGRKSVFIVASRGCPGRCPFCYLRAHAPGPIRTLASDVLVRQLMSLESRLGVRGFYFLDDAFTGDRARVESFCEELRRNNCNFRWFCDSRIEDLRPKSLPTLWNAGARSFYIGLESGSDRIRAALKKTMPVDAAKDRLRLLLDLGFNLKLSLVVGWPGECAADMELTVALADALPDAQLDVYRYCPLPGTLLGDQLLRRLSEVERDQIRFSNWESSSRNFSSASDADVNTVHEMLVTRQEERSRARTPVA